MLPVVANPPPPEAAPPNQTPEATLSNPLHAAAPANPAPEDPKAANPPLKKQHQQTHQQLEHLQSHLLNY